MEEDIKLDNPVGSLTKCPEHSDTPLKYYCETCKKGMCQACSQSHSKHILYNLHALAQTMGDQISSIDKIYDAYQSLDKRYSKLHQLLQERRSETEDAIASIKEWAEAKVENWIGRLAGPIRQLVSDVARKKEEIELPLKAMEEVMRKKEELSAAIESARESGHYLKIYQLKDQIRSAFLSEAQVESMANKIAVYERRYESERIGNAEAIKEKISAIFAKLDEMKPAWKSLIFNISPKATRAEIIDIPKKQRRILEFDLQIEGFDAVILKRQLYIIGGMDMNKTYLKNCLAFSIKDGLQAGKKHDMVIERIGHTVIPVSKNYIYCVGGYNARLKYLNQCEKYNAYLNKWIAIPHLNEHKSQTSLSCLEEKYLYAIGGSMGPTRWVKTLEVLEIEGEFKGWKVVKYGNAAEKWQGVYCAGAVAISSYQILIFGGIQADKRKECYLFDKNGVEEVGKSLPEEASFYQRKPVVVDGRVYASNIQNEVLTCIPGKNWSRLRIEDFTLL